MEDFTLSIKLLTTALADEWLAHYQYWTCKNLVNGAVEYEAEEEFDEHEMEEKIHADWIVDRLKEIGGSLIPNPNDWSKFANPFVPADSQDVKRLLAITIEAEKAAIDFYESAIKQLEGKDNATCLLFEEILKDETHHYYDLMKLATSLPNNISDKTISLKKKNSAFPKFSVYRCDNISWDLSGIDIDKDTLPEYLYIEVKDTNEDGSPRDTDNICLELSYEIAERARCPIYSFSYEKID